jgi:ADP-heptose:LPS heptosyltransferase
LRVRADGLFETRTFALSGPVAADPERPGWHPVAMPLPPRLLAVRTGAIGDVVNALVFAAAVKEAAPETRIGWVVHPLAAPLVTGHPAVDRVHPWKRGGGVRELVRLVRELRAERYPLAVDLQRIQKSALVARLAAPRVLGFDRARTKEVSWLWTTERVGPETGPHRVDGYLDLARHLGCPARAPRFLLPRDEAAEAWAAGLVRDLGGAPVLVNLGASKPENRWEPERAGALALALAERGVAVCLTGGPGDRAAAERAVRAASAQVRDLVGHTSLLQLAALARRARLFVGCDTGPMHLAAAAGARVVALFGPADPARTGPYGAGQRVVRAPSRRMEDLDVAAVLAAVETSLGEAAALRERS